MKIKTFYCYREFNIVVDEAKLVHDLRRGLGRQIVDVDIIANAMKEADISGDGQLTSGQVEDVLTETNIKIDRTVLKRWMKFARQNGLTTISIAKLLHLLQRSVNPMLSLQKGTFTEMHYFESASSRLQ